MDFKSRASVLDNSASADRIRSGQDLGQQTTTTIKQDREGGSLGTESSLVPARIDRLRWSRFHTRLVIALGVAWILDGLEITIASNSTAIISSKSALGLSSSSVAFSVGTVYLLGEVVGALFFGRLSDKWGRCNLFMITLGVYLVGGALTALTIGHTPRLGLLARHDSLYRRNGHRW